MSGMTPAASAAQEAWEEAGVVGKPYDLCLGLYSYNKVGGPRPGIPCVAMVYPMQVKTLEANFPERSERRRRWYSVKKAASRVSEPELARIIRDFDPRRLR